MKKPIFNLADAPIRSDSHGDRFAYSIAQLAGPAGGKSIGANVTRVPPGKAAFPIHHHFANEEHFFILSGSGVLRVGAETFAVKQHDYVANLPGGAELAHQLVNTGKEDLVYLAISTMTVPEVVGYPDTGKTGVRTGMQADGRFLLREADKNSVQYWEGEDGVKVATVVTNAR